MITIVDVRKLVATGTLPNNPTDTAILVAACTIGWVRIVGFGMEWTEQGAKLAKYLESSLKCRVFHLHCACCGEDAPAFKQWFNQDTGYGLCSRCNGNITAKEGADYVRDCYGHAGVHHSLDISGTPVPGNHSECGPDCCITGDRCDGLHAPEYAPSADNIVIDPKHGGHHTKKLVLVDEDSYISREVYEALAPCLGCGDELSVMDEDPNGDKNPTCARCRAEEEHDFDAEPGATFNRRGDRIAPPVKLMAEEDTPPENCVALKDMNVIQTVHAMKMLAEKFGGGLLGVGIWEGEIHGKLSGSTYPGPHVAVFTPHALVAPFGPQGDAESEALAVLFMAALQNAERIEKAFALMCGFIEKVSESAYGTLHHDEAYGVLVELKELK